MKGQEIAKVIGVSVPTLYRHLPASVQEKPDAEGEGDGNNSRTALPRVGCPTVLVEVTDEAGFDPVEVIEMLAGDKGKVEVEAELDRAAALGTWSVPTVLVDGRPLCSGAIPPDAVAAHLRRQPMAADGVR